MNTQKETEEVEVYGTKLPLGKMLERIAGAGMGTLERLTVAEAKITALHNVGMALIGMIKSQHEDIETMKRILSVILPDCAAELAHERLPEAIKREREIAELQKLFGEKDSDDPWMDAEKKFEPGTVVEGPVVRLMEFGAFVQVDEHIEGLIHVGDITAERPNCPQDVLKIGEKIRAVVLNCDREKRRLRLGMKQLMEGDVAPGECN